jgi:hypothetical protein
MSKLLKYVLPALVVITAACASGGARSRCTPVTGEFLSAGMAYRDCEVTFRAEMSTAPRVSPPMRMAANTCVSAWYDFIVDTTGHVVEHTAKLIKTNNQPWAEAVKRQLGEARYRPAMKGNKKVQQLVRWKADLPIVVVATSTSGVSARPSVAGNVPNC